MIRIAIVSISLLWIHFSPVVACQSSDESKPEPFELQRLVASIRPSLAVIRVDDRDGKNSGVGSGFVIAAEGLIATNFHVIGESRSFTVELWPNRKLPVLAIEASDRDADLAIVRVDPQGEELKPISLSSEAIAQGTQVAAFGNPLGLKHSVVQGIVSAVREIEGRELLQLAMPIEPGNSGGPVVDGSGNVHGIVNMKSAIDENLGFAIPVQSLRKLIEQRNPVSIERWIRRNRLDPKSWTTFAGAQWSQRSGIIRVSGSGGGSGGGFGGRSLCLSQKEPEEESFDLSVMVQLQEESGAAGLVFHSDGNDCHYGFYPSNGKMRLSCFRGPDVFSWQVLAEVPSSHYLAGEWNQLKVRVAPNSIKCFVNGYLTIESQDGSFTTGKAGLAKFRDTEARFKDFRCESIMEGNAEEDHGEKEWVSQISQDAKQAFRLTDRELRRMAKQDQGNLSDSVASRANQVEKHAKQLQRVAADLRTAQGVERLRSYLDLPDAEPLEGSLWLAKIDHPEIDVNDYLQRVQSMADEIKKSLPQEANEEERIKQLNRYLFDENGFHGGREDYYNAANSQMDRVIDDAEGMPLSLCILYTYLARKLDLNVVGIGLPGHFVVRHIAADGNESFLDVFDRGQRLGAGNLSALVLANTGRPLAQDDLSPPSTRDILARMVRNLLGAAERQRDEEAIVRYVDVMVAMFPEDPQYRMLRASIRRQTNRWMLAVEDIDWLIDHPTPRLDPQELIPLRELLLNQLP